MFHANAFSSFNLELITYKFNLHVEVKLLACFKFMCVLLKTFFFVEHE